MSQGVEPAGAGDPRLQAAPEFRVVYHHPRKRTRVVCGVLALVGDSVDGAQLRTRVSHRDRHDGEAEAHCNCLGETNGRAAPDRNHAVSLGGGRLPACRLRQRSRHVLSYLGEASHSGGSQVREELICDRRRRARSDHQHPFQVGTGHLGRHRPHRPGTENDPLRHRLHDEVERRHLPPLPADRDGHFPPRSLHAAIYPSGRRGALPVALLVV